MNSKIKGSLFTLSSTSLYAMYGIYTRLIGENFKAFSSVSIRSLIIVVILGLYFLFKKNNWNKIVKKKNKWLVLWIILGTLMGIILYFSFNNLAIGTAYYLFYSTMIIGGYLSGKIIFKEKIDKTKLISLILVFIGLIFIYYSEIKIENLLFIVLTLIAGTFAGIWNTISKKISDVYSDFQLIFFDAIINFILNLFIFILLKEKIPAFSQTISWIAIFTYAVSQITAMSLMIKGFKFLEAQIATIIMPIEVVFATVFAFIFFKEVLSINTIVGGLFIFSAAILPNILLIKKKT